MKRLLNRLRHNRRGGTMVEFAIVAPTFLMFVFLILDGGRMMYTRQALNEVALAAARHYALDTTISNGQLKTWIIANSRLGMTSSNTTVATNPNTTCNSLPGAVATVTITMPFHRGAMSLLPQSVVSTSQSATGCFMIPS